MNHLYNKDKDLVFIRRASNNQEFEEYPLIVQPCSFLALDPSNNLVCYPIGSVLISSASYALTASYALNGGSGGSETQISCSWASASLSSSYLSDQHVDYALTRSMVVNYRQLNLQTDDFFVGSTGATAFIDIDSGNFSYIYLQGSSSTYGLQSIRLNADDGTGTFTGDITANAFSGDGSQITNIQSASYAITASYSENTKSASYASTCSFAIFNYVSQSIQSSSYSNFASQSISSSYATNADTASYLEAHHIDYALTRSMLVNYRQLNLQTDDFFVGSTGATAFIDIDSGNFAYLYLQGSSSTYGLQSIRLNADDGTGTFTGDITAPAFSGSLYGTASYADMTDVSLSSSYLSDQHIDYALTRSMVVNYRQLNLQTDDFFVGSTGATAFIDIDSGNFAYLYLQGSSSTYGYQSVRLNADDGTGTYTGDITANAFYGSNLFVTSASIGNAQLIPALNYNASLKAYLGQNQTSTWFGGNYSLLEFIDSASGQPAAAIGFDPVSNGSTAGQFSLAGKATQVNGNVCGFHVANLNIGSGDNRMFVLRIKDPGAGTADSGSYVLFENRYNPNAPDCDTKYANFLLCNQYGNVGLGDLGFASDTTNPVLLANGKVTIYGSPNGTYPIFKVYQNSASVSSIFTIAANGQVNCSVITASLFNGTASYANTASYALSSSFITASNVVGTVISASHSLTSSYALSAIASLTTGTTYPITSSWAISASWASSSLSSSYATTASYAFTSSWISASNVQGTVQSASYTLTASYALNSNPGIGNVIYSDITNFTYSQAAADYNVNFMHYTKSLISLPSSGMYRLNAVAYGSQSNSVIENANPIVFGAKFTDEWGSYIVMDDWSMIGGNPRPPGFIYAGPIMLGYGGQFRYYYSYLFSGVTGTLIEYYWTDEGLPLGDNSENFTASIQTKVTIEKLL